MSESDIQECHAGTSQYLAAYGWFVVVTVLSFAVDGVAGLFKQRRSD